MDEIRVTSIAPQLRVMRAAAAWQSFLFDFRFWPNCELFVDAINVGYVGTCGPDLLGATRTGHR
jgi:hypothetical protein